MQAIVVVDPTLRQAAQGRKAMKHETTVRWRGGHRQQPIREHIRLVSKMARTRGSRGGRGRQRGGMHTRNSQNNDDSAGSQTGKKPTNSDSKAHEVVTEEDVRKDRAKAQSLETTRKEGAPLMSWRELQADEPTGDGDLDRSIEEELGEGENGKDGGETEWTIRKEDKLIDLFEQCKFMYNKDHAEYKLKFKKELTYATFAKKLGMTGEFHDVFLHNKYIVQSNV